MIDPHKKFDVPLPYLGQKISKELRIKLFKTIVDGYNKRYPYTKPVLAFLNWDPELEVDFLFMIHATNTKNMKFILYDLALFGSRRSIPGYRYCIMNDLNTEYFEDGFSSMTPIELSQFNSMIVSTLGLSLNKDDANYWKKSENMPKLIKHLKEINIRFQPQKQE